MQFFFAVIATAVALSLVRKDNSTVGQFPAPAAPTAAAGQFPAPTAAAGQFPAPTAAPGQFPPPTAAPGAAPVGGAGMCPGQGLSRVWYMCVGPEFDASTAEEYAAGIEVGNEMCCTPEYDFECLCCLDFKMLPFTRCGDMTLNAANEPPGSPVALADDAQMPAPTAPAMAPNGPPVPRQIVTVCTKDAPVGAMAAGQQTDGAPVTLPVNCIAREFTVAEIAGQTPDVETGLPLAPGQTVLDERIAFLVAQGIPAADIPTCKAEIATCPIGTPKAGSPPNSAGQDALSSIGAGGFLGESVQQQAVQLVEEEQLLAEQKSVKRSRGRTFEDLAKMTTADVEKILGDKRMLAFAKEDHSTVAFRVETVTSGGTGLTLTGEGKTLQVGKTVELSEGDAKTEVAPSTVVLTLEQSSRRVHSGRGRAAFLTTSGSFTLSSGGFR